MRASKAENEHAPAGRSRDLPGSLRLIGGLLIIAGSCVFLWFNVRSFLVDTIVQLLSSAQVNVSRSVCAGDPELAVRLLDGSSLNIMVTWQRSGLVSALIFGVLFLSYASTQGFDVVQDALAGIRFCHRSVVELHSLASSDPCIVSLRRWSICYSRVLHRTYY